MMPGRKASAGIFSFTMVFERLMMLIIQMNPFTTRNDMIRCPCRGKCPDQPGFYSGCNL